MDAYTLLQNDPTYGAVPMCDGSVQHVWYWRALTDSDAIDLAYELAEQEAEIRTVRSLESGDLFEVDDKAYTDAMNKKETT